MLSWSFISDNVFHSIWSIALLTASRNLDVAYKNSPFWLFRLVPRCVGSTSNDEICSLCFCVFVRLENVLLTSKSLVIVILNFYPRTSSAGVSPFTLDLFLYVISNRWIKAKKLRNTFPPCLHDMCNRLDNYFCYSICSWVVDRWFRFVDSVRLAPCFEVISHKLGPVIRD